MAISLLTMHTPTMAQSGFIYVHLKTLNEAGSPPVSYSVSGGGTAVPDFTLNDTPSQTILADIGASENGRLWAVSTANALYYRDANSAAWVQTSISDAKRVDGGPGGSCFYINTSGTVFSFSGSGTPTQISATGQFTPSNADIGSGWTTTPYVVDNGAAVFKYSGAGTTWTTYASITNYFATKVDVNPGNGNVYVGVHSGSTWNVRQITPALAITSLGGPAPGTSSYRDLAVNENGEIYVVSYNGTGWYNHKYTSGTSWAAELGSFDGSSLTGGVGNSLWLTMNSGGWNNGSGWSPAAGPYPFYNIFSRGFNGSEATYIDDERVRTSATGNSILIPVTPGTYNITESVPGGWDLQKISVYDPSANSTSTLTTATASLDVAANEVVHVVFQTGQTNPFPMTTDCANAYLETFGTGAVGSYGNPVNGQTTYHYLAGNAPGEDGYYKIVNRANPDFNTWAAATGIVDHTPGDGSQGYMYAVNAGYDKGEFFRRRFTGVIPGATYDFSAWLVDLTASAPVNPNVSFTVFDHHTQAVLGTFSTGELTSATTPGAWQKYGFSFVATTDDIDLVIGNNGLGGNGNDLALDDISFSLTPPTPSIVVQNSNCADGLGSITITAPLGVDYEYSIDGTNWQTATLFDDLQAGPYTVSVRFTGTINCTNSSTLANVNPAICGNVFHDANGLTDGTVNGTGIGSAGATPLYVSLYNGSTLVATVPVNPDGTYSFTDVAPNITYSIVLGTDAVANPTSSFEGSGSGNWVATGEDCCDNAGSDGVVSGSLTVTVNTVNVNNANLAIQQLPESDPKYTQIFQPVIGQVITLNGGANPPVLSGSDPEDMPSAGPLTGKTVTITTVPDNSELYYDNALLTDGTVIANFDPSKLQIKFTTATIGDTLTQFKYAYTDLAGMTDPTPAIYELRWEDPMPVTLVSFDVSKSEMSVLISWTTASETNSAYFDIERSADARNWSAIGRVKAAEFTNTLSRYHFTDPVLLPGNTYYRLKMVDLDESYTYSQIRTLFSSGIIAAYPNPVTDRLFIGGTNSQSIQNIAVYDKTGKLVYSDDIIADKSIDLTHLQSGVYILRLTYKDSTKVSQTFIKN